ncbi:MAG: SUMF1/EgtB/PvdO family nonheme iron enzyme [Proteobacteria bacterium]|nr:SUMF1/EgtB/PvdO family nonheme iron enzyme [Pseudomonadota bacterium]
MRRLLSLATFVCLVLLLAAPAWSAPQPERRVALVIGNGAYKTAPLKNPANDARDMAAALRSVGFEVIERENAGLRQMNEAIDQFWQSLRKGGVGLFFFAGHGLQVSGENYLVPVDARVAMEQDVQYECVNAGKVLGRMENAGNGLNIVILDACRNNPFARSFRSDSRGLAKMDAPTGSLVAFATAPGDVAADGAGKNGLYTSHLLRVLRTPGLKIEDVLKQVRIGVAADSAKMGKRQTPWESSSLMGDFYFKPGVGQAATAPPAVASPSAAPQAPPQLAMAPAPKEPPAPAAEPKVGDTWTEPTTGMEFVWVPGGTYEMGCGPWAGVSGLGVFGECQSHEKPVHAVRLDGFWLGKYEVTQSQWEKLMRSNPSKSSRGAKYPVENVSWYDAKEFLSRLNAQGAGRFRLPTEAEWEYAARSGGKPEKYAGGGDVVRVAWYGSNSDASHEVGSKAPNGLGLFDMSGNVWEWCEDVYDEDAYASHARENPLISGGGSERVYRGGGWYSMYAKTVRTGNRFHGSPDRRAQDHGLRLVGVPFSPPQAAAPLATQPDRAGFPAGEYRLAGHSSTMALLVRFKDAGATLVGTAKGNNGPFSFEDAVRDVQLKDGQLKFVVVQKGGLFPDIWYRFTCAVSPGAEDYPVVKTEKRFSATGAYAVSTEFPEARLVREEVAPAQQPSAQMLAPAPAAPPQPAAHDALVNRFAGRYAVAPGPNKKPGPLVLEFDIKNGQLVGTPSGGGSATRPVGITDIRLQGESLSFRYAYKLMVFGVASDGYTDFTGKLGEDMSAIPFRFATHDGNLRDGWLLRLPK